LYLDVGVEARRSNGQRRIRFKNTWEDDMTANVGQAFLLCGGVFLLSFLAI
jgi:hypothetical protein